jgi:hypothetical protein
MIDKESLQAIRDIVKDEVRIVVKDEVRTIVKEEVRTIVKEEVRAVVKDEVRAIVKDEVSGLKEDVGSLKVDVSGLKEGFVGINKKLDIHSKSLISIERDIKAVYDVHKIAVDALIISRKTQEAVERIEHQTIGNSLAIKKHTQQIKQLQNAS